MRCICPLGGVKPDLSRVTLMFNPDTVPYFDTYLRSFNASPKQTSAEVEAGHVRSVAKVELAVAKLGREPRSALIAASDIFILAARGAILGTTDNHSAHKKCAEQWFMSAFGPKQTSASALHMSAFDPKRAFEVTGSELEKLLHCPSLWRVDLGQIDCDRSSLCCTTKQANRCCR